MEHIVNIKREMCAHYLTSLRCLVGLPEGQTFSDALGFVASSILTDVSRESLKRSARAMKRDLVVAIWSDPDADQPTEFAVVMRQMIKGQIYEGLQPWTMGFDGQLSFVSRDRRTIYIVDRRGILYRSERIPVLPIEGLGLARSRIEKAFAARTQAAARAQPNQPQRANWRTDQHG